MNTKLFYAFLVLVISSTSVLAQRVDHHIRSGGSSFNQNNLSCQIAIGNTTGTIYSNEVQLAQTHFLPQAIDDVVLSSFNQLDDIRTYPNPVNNKINIDLQKDGVYQVSVLSLVGTILVTKNTSSSSVSIDIANLPKGSYLLKVTSENQSTTKTLIKD